MARRRTLRRPRHADAWSRRKRRMLIAWPARSQPNYITPAGFAALQAAHHQLFDQERPKMVEVVSWAAGNGDRSENGDYIYGRKRLREIDRELNRLAKRMKDAQVVDPRQIGRAHV